MKARKSASLGLLILLIGFAGCGSEANSTGTSTEPGIAISPVSASAGDSDLVLTVTGSKFFHATHDKSVVV
jgi:hypothetical protein